MALNETYELAVIGTLQGQQYYHTLHFRQIDLSPEPNVEQSLIDAWQASVQDEWLAIHPGPGYTLDTIRCRKVCGSLPLPVPVEEPVGTAGTRPSGASQQLAPWLTLVVNERTAVVGRSRRGRFFVSGATEDDVNGNNWVTVAGLFYALVGAYATAVMARFGPAAPTNGFILVVHSRTLATPGTPCQNSSTVVTQLVRSIAMGTQKSRK